MLLNEVFVVFDGLGQKSILEFGGEFAVPVLQVFQCAQVVVICQLVCGLEDWWCWRYSGALLGAPKHQTAYLRSFPLLGNGVAGYW